jgi:hypothetical protein
MSNDAVQHRWTEDSRETGNTPSERSPSPISNNTTNYENIESDGGPISMDISSDSAADEPTPERPRKELGARYMQQNSANQRSMTELARKLIQFLSGIVERASDQSPIPLMTS